MANHPNPKISDPRHDLVEYSASKLQWTGEVRCLPEQLDLPLRWKKPRRIFACNQADLFHPDVPDEFIAAVFGVMAACPQHIFQVLTKRPERMRQWFEWAQAPRGCAVDTWVLHCAGRYTDRIRLHRVKGTFLSYPWPLPNVWLGVSVEDQRTADDRIPLLLQMPAAVRFASCEPLIASVNLLHPTWMLGPPTQAHGMHQGLDWVIVGSESGPGARPCDLAWIRSLVEQCKAAGTKCFVKQVGPNPYERRETPSGEGWDPSDLLAGNARDDAAHRKWFKEWTLVKTSEGSAFYRYLKLRDRKGGDMSEWPSDLRIREMPEVRR